MVPSHRQARVVPEGALAPEAPGRFHCRDDLRYQLTARQHAS
jgi:hypothetical protein